MDAASDDRRSGDAELVQRCQRGDAHAFAGLVREHRQAVLRIARAIVGCPEEAEDVAQESLVRAYRGIGRFDPTRDFGAWLHAITVNRSITALKRRRRAAALFEVGDPPEVACGGGTEQSVSGRALERRIRQLIDTLPLRQRLAITIFGLEEMDLAATAAAMGCSVGSVKTHLHRARRKLAAELVAEFGEEAGP